MAQDRGEEVRKLLGGSRYQRLFALVRARIERAGIAAARTVSVRGLSLEERDALAGLLGQAEPIVEGASLRLDALDAALRESRLGVSLEEALEALGGPLANRKAERLAARARRESLYASAREHPTVRARPALEAWLDELERAGLVARAARRFSGDQARVLALALEAVSLLPAEGIPLPVLAARLTGDAHALDAGRLLPAIVLRAAQRLAGWPRLPANAEERRRLWAEVGVECDTLSPSVLTFGLRPLGDDPLSTRMRLSRPALDPVRIMLFELERHGLPRVRHEQVFIVENPALIALAARSLGPKAPPLACVEGVPTTAASRLLAGLREQGVALRFHGDFDWGGLRIANGLRERFDATPWRMAVTDYREALDRLDETAPLTGEPVEASWDAALSDEMRARGAAVYEEQLFEVLLDELANTEDRAAEGAEPGGASSA